jgi:glycerate kinase
MGHDNPVTLPVPLVAGRRLVAAPDKYRGTATAAEVVAGIEGAAAAAGWTCDAAPVADGGEGTLEALGGAVRRTTVRGPLGDPVAAEWRMQDDGTAVVEMARASGLSLAGGPEGNDPLRASTYGTGELIGAAIDAGAVRVIVGVGGSASTDGGLGALSALRPDRRPGLGRAIEVVVACDVTTRFVDAAESFGPQKGATPAQVSLLRRRLERLAEIYVQDYGVDVRDIPGAGAAGGLAGGLAAAGASLVPGFDVVAESLALAERIAGADLVVTGEGLFDAGSFDGKAAGGVLALAAEAGVPVLVVAGDVDHRGLPPMPGDLEPGARVESGDRLESAGRVELVSLIERFGVDAAYKATVDCVAAVVAERLAR